MQLFSQTTARVTISVKASVEDVLGACKYAGKKNKFGSRDYNLEEGTLTLWKEHAVLDAFETRKYFQLAYISAQHDNGITTFTIRINKEPGLILNQKKRVKKIVRKLKLKDMKIGEYFYDVE
tara:strand:+ start:149 stop:514 length:366 start_codon:yes stop_codon:yes gene_type:complete